MEWMVSGLQTMVSWTFIESLAQTVSGFSTFFIAILTLFLLYENRKLRKAGSRPWVVAYIEPHPDGTGALNICIANIGTGPARDVSFSIDGDAQEFERYKLILNVATTRPPIPLLPQGEKISFLFAIGYNLFKRQEPGGITIDQPLAPFNIRTQWRALNRREEYSDSFSMDVRAFDNLPGIVSKPYLLQIVESIDKIGEEIKSLKSP